jgi:hypothetical protein
MILDTTSRNGCAYFTSGVQHQLLANSLSIETAHTVEACRISRFPSLWIRKSFEFFFYIWDVKFRMDACPPSRLVYVFSIALVHMVCEWWIWRDVKTFLAFSKLLTKQLSIVVTLRIRKYPIRISVASPVIVTGVPLSLHTNCGTLHWNRSRHILHPCLLTVHGYTAL